MAFEVAKCLDAAQGIADMLCETAIWDRQSQTCNWLSASVDPRDQTLRPIGFDLYSGLPGAALFLAAAHVVFGDEESRRTSIAALRTAHLQAQTAPVAGTDLSIFEGRFGLHFVTGQVSRLLKIMATDAVLDEVSRLLFQATGLPHSFDVVSGSAGAICGLIGFEPQEFRPQLSAYAVRLGEELLYGAGLANGRFAWGPADAGGAAINAAPLCGFAHGASGIATALLRLFQRSQRVEFLTGARIAFAYEDEAFDPQLGSWPDLRADAVGAGGFDAWCHGAGGVALARLEAMRCDTQCCDRHRAVAAAALQKTHDALSASLEDVQSDDGLCHGITGLAQICHLGGEALSNPALTGGAAAAATAVAEKYSAWGALSDWPAEVVTRPGLMIGVSGVGYSLLGFAGARLPSVLNLFEPLV